MKLAACAFAAVAGGMRRSVQATESELCKSVGSFFKRDPVMHSLITLIHCSVLDVKTVIQTEVDVEDGILKRWGSGTLALKRWRAGDM
ncbi:unnamed protein product, partial [Symbiodinium natans]